MKKFLLFSFLTAFAYSCKYDNTVHKYLYNYSNDTVTVTTPSEVIVMNPGDFQLVQTNVYGGVQEAVPCEDNIEFSLTFSSGRTLVKSLDSTEAWDGNIDGDNHLFQECYFRIFEVDLQ